MIVLGIIVAIIVAIMLIPVGADIGYENGELRIAAKVCGAQLQIIPNEGDKEKKPKPEKEPKPKKEKPAPDPNKPKKKLNLSFNYDEIMGLLKAVLRGFGKFRKTKIDRFLLNYVAAGKDPYQTAVNFGYVNAALNALIPECHRRFACKDAYIKTDIDFTTEEMKLDAGLAFSIRIGQIFAVSNTILFGAAWILLKNKLRLKKEKRQQKKSGITEEPEQDTVTEETKENIQSEERTNNNGEE